MKKINKMINLLLCICVTSGCATKHYGRQSTLTEYEKHQLNCKEIDIEIAKATGFIDSVDKESKFNVKSVFSFLGDFGIGNVMEKNAALESAHQRLKDLQNLKAQKGCVINLKSSPYY